MPGIARVCRWDARDSLAGLVAALEREWSVTVVLSTPCPRVLCETYPFDSPACLSVANPEALECVFEHMAAGEAFGFALEQPRSEGFAQSEIIEGYAVLGDARAVRLSRSMGWTNHEDGPLLGEQEFWWGDVDREGLTGRTWNRRRRGAPSTTGSRGLDGRAVGSRG